MARYFSQAEIDEFRDCFLLTTCSNTHITTKQELATIMRSLRLSPTSKELDSYLKAKEGRLAFADLLEVLHSHGNKEKPIDQIRAAFQALDWKKSGHVPIADLRHVLCHWGCEPLDDRSLQRLLREANVKGTLVDYEQIIRILTAPQPDY